MLNSLKDKYPQLCEEWDYVKNGTLKPEDVYSSSKKRVWWICKKGHSFEARIVSRKNGSSCLYCSHQKIELATSLATLFPELIREWDYLRNSPLKPEDVFPTAQKKVWWVCKVHGSYLCSCANKSKQKRGCPYCSHQKVHLDSCLATLFPDLVKFWSEKNGNTLFELLPYSRKKNWWLCEQGHEYSLASSNRVDSYKNGNSGCPFCSGKKISSTNNLLYLFPEIASEWDYSKNIDITPDKITAKNGKSVWWICTKGHSWIAKISNRTSTNKTGCPKCSESKRENEVREIFEKIFNSNFPKSRPAWLLNPETNRHLELDGFNCDLNLAFEYDGEWHYIPVRRKFSNLSQLIKQKERDILKDYLCQEKGITLLRIPYNIKNLEQYISHMLIKEKYVHPGIKTLISNF